MPEKSGNKSRPALNARSFETVIWATGRVVDPVSVDPDSMNPDKDPAFQVNPDPDPSGF